MTFVFGFVFGRKRFSSFVYVSVSAENRITFSSPVSFSAENAFTGFGRSLIVCLICRIRSEKYWDDIWLVYVRCQKLEGTNPLVVPEFKKLGGTGPLRSPWLLRLCMQRLNKQTNILIICHDSSSLVFLCIVLLFTNLARFHVLHAERTVFSQFSLSSKSFIVKCHKNQLIHL